MKKQNSPRPNPDISLNPHNPLLVKESMRLTDYLVNSIPGTLCR